MNFCEVEKFTNRYKLKYKVINNLIYVHSIWHEWYIEQVDSVTFSLYHKNTKNETNRFHLQKVFKDTHIGVVFKSIYDHDKFVLKNKHTKHNRVIELLNKLHNDNKNTNNNRMISI